MYTKILLNALRLERLEKMSIKERGKIVAKLKKDTGKSYRELAQMTGIPHTTLVDWVTKRQNNIPGNLHISIDRMIEHFKVYKPRLPEFDKIEELITILRKCIER